MTCQSKKCVLSCIIWWELFNMVVYTPVAVFGLGWTILYVSGFMSIYSDGGAGLGIAMIIDICMGFYHAIFTSTGLYITTSMKLGGDGDIFK